MKSIAKGAFSGCSTLLGLSLPETITTLDDEALEGCDNLLALRWNAEKALPTEALSDVYATNPNFLLYVKDKAYAPSDIKNVVVNGTAETVILSEANSGNSFYCPWPFTAKSIQLTHRYGMTSGYQACQGWETIALPFDVTAVFSDTGAELVPRKTWTHGDKANTPYIISMPNNVEHYDEEYNVSGDVTFVGANVRVKASDDLVTGQYGQRRFLPSFQYKEANYGIFALNVSNQWDQYASGTYQPDSTFIRALRPIHPFEAYMAVEGTNAPQYIPVFDSNEETGIRDVLLRKTTSHASWYTLDGRKLQGHPTQKGLYITSNQFFKNSEGVMPKYFLN